MNAAAKDMMCTKVDPDAKPYEVLYFPVSALGEPIRLVLTLGGLEFTDTTPRNDESFAERKKALSPYGDAGQGPISAGDVLVFTLHLLKVNGAGKPVVAAGGAAGGGHGGGKKGRGRGGAAQEVELR